MTIRFKNNTIEFESGTNQWVLSETPVGFDFLGTISATQFNAFQAMGDVAGYSSGGSTKPVPAPGILNTIDTFPFANNANATDVGDLSVDRYETAGQSSPAYGYNSGGWVATPVAGAVNNIDRFGFGTTANATDVGDLTVARQAPAGQSSSVSGYSSGGLGSNVIDKFPFASNANASDVGDLTVARGRAAGQSSSASGYTSGGAPAGTNTIDKFPFAANANATDVGDLTVARNAVAGQSSTASGYTSGDNLFTTVVDKFPFSVDANATDVGDLTVGREEPAGQSSTVSGYTSGGGTPAVSNTIDKFPFASDANATDVGDLTVARFGVTGTQY